MTAKSILISGAGIAGPTLAYWLLQLRFRADAGRACPPPAHGRLRDRFLGPRLRRRREDGARARAAAAGLRRERGAPRRRGGPSCRGFRRRRLPRADGRALRKLGAQRVGAASVHQDRRPLRDAVRRQHHLTCGRGRRRRRHLRAREPAPLRSRDRRRRSAFAGAPTSRSALRRSSRRIWATWSRPSRPKAIARATSSPT